ncbi:MAG: UDP-galactose-lipid carrier transferase [Acidimicrobiales bacterium]|nr:UDP-galactose-lipid carrier transferase [Acidimicrobiales bacterium]
MADSHHRWRIPVGIRPRLDEIDTRSTEGAPGKKAETAEATRPLVEELSVLQTRLWAEHRRSLLLVLQAMDAGGKDGTVRKVFTGVNPQGVRVNSFKAPSEEELAHDFLWRIHQRVPAAGEIGVFNRSHYEDVLVARVEELVPEDVWRGRYATIRDFERSLVEARTTVVKVFLHISKDEQRERLQARLDDPDRRWKFSVGDLGVRAKWDQYATAYADAIGETTTDHAPWYVVPADHKWYRDWAVLNILLGHLRALDPQYPPEEPGLRGLVIE